MMKQQTPDGEYIVLYRLEGNDPTHMKGLQLWLAPHADFIVMMWWAVWTLTLITIVYHTVREFWARRNI